MSGNIPCENCITFAICKAETMQSNSIIDLTRKCSIIDLFLRGSSEAIGDRIELTTLNIVRNFYRLEGLYFGEKDEYR